MKLNLRPIKEKNNKLPIVIIIIILFYQKISFSQAIELDWAGGVGGTSVTWGYSSCDDDLGNIYVVGNFTGTTDFDMGSGVSNLVSSGGQDAFICKYSSQGQLIWAKKIGNIGTDNAISITLDLLGNILITGKFRGIVDFDPGAGIFNLTQIGGNENPYILKLDFGGNFIWAKNFTGAGNSGCTIYDITIDDFGNLYTTGHIDGEIDFDPGIGVYNLSSSTNNSDLFIQKLDSNGNFQWVKLLNSLGNDRGSAIATGLNNSLYITGFFSDTVDFDPGVSVFNLVSVNPIPFIQKLDTGGNFIWAKALVSNGSSDGAGIALEEDSLGNIYTSGYFRGTFDFDPGAGIYNITSAGTGTYDTYIEKLDSSGNLMWIRTIGGVNDEFPKGIDIDYQGSIYITGNCEGSVDFDPGAGVFNLHSSDTRDDIFVMKLNSNGLFGWVERIGENWYNSGESLTVDDYGNITVLGYFGEELDFEPGQGTYTIAPSGSRDMFLLRLSQKRIVGRMYNDLNQDCIQDNNESNLAASRTLILNPGNQIIVSDANGIWGVDSLPVGNYSITTIPQGTWNLTCPDTQFFSIPLIDTFINAPAFGFTSTTPCAAPDIFINAPFLRPGFSNQKVFVKACNQRWGSTKLDSIYVVVEMDSLLTVQSASVAYTNLGNNKYQVFIDSLYPGFCHEFWFDCQLSTNAVLGQSLCFEAKIQPKELCALDTIRAIYPNSFTPCTTPYDQSHLEIDAFCINDSIHFQIINTGGGGMSCFSPIKLYIDTVFTFLDSIQLLSGDTTSFIYSGDGRTWRMELEQHPLHPGNSKPSATIELCGNPINWTPNLVNVFPHDDADPDVDIYCGLVTGSYDPNDKQGYPLGVHRTNEISPNQELEYVIRFQNTGTDTAFTVIIRDTLTSELDVHSVLPGTSSHPYSFKIYGLNVLEWIFYDIMLPDSSVNIAESQGYVSFTVNQVINLSLGTRITNDAQIYFDFNSPINTNSTIHTLANPQINNLDGEVFISEYRCGTYTFNNVTYNKSGIYYQVVNNGNKDSLFILNLDIDRVDSVLVDVFSCNNQYLYNNQNYSISGVYYHSYTNSVGCDSIVQLNLLLGVETSSTITESMCNEYTAPDGQVYTSSGSYTAVISNYVGCDSVITIDLTIKDSTSSTIAESVCNEYTAPDGQVYTASGQYTAVISNYAGCDSVITIDLTIKDSTSSTIAESVCNEYTAPDGQVYTSSGSYTAVISNYAGCDSVITIDLTIKDSTSSTIAESVCNEYTAPDGQVYTSSGSYTAVIANYVGCDSVIAIDLTIKDSTSSTITESLCNEYTAPDGQVYTASGQYTAVISNYAGCDSVITIDLTIKDSTSSTTIENVCEEYTAPNGQVYTISGQHIEIIPNVEGCDSVITINFTIDSMPLDTIILNGTTLSLGAVGMAYQWLNCNNGNTPISGATNSTFTPSVSGNYAVEITNGACVVQSNCVNVTIVGNKNLVNKTVISVYPNPVKSILYIDQQNSNEIDYQLIDNLGRVLLQGKSINEITELNIKSFAPGVYFLSVNDGNQSIIYKVVKN